ncbi:hypothetical protein [Candidatus Palauibacter sp.]|uniref:hypothetical protein n=1 Tax=Candidatus Palauibacter sp. TaxID=3101350 RepID=UPI003B51FBB8
MARMLDGLDLLGRLKRGRNEFWRLLRVAMLHEHAPTGDVEIVEDDAKIVEDDEEVGGVRTSGERRSSAQRHELPSRVVPHGAGNLIHP